MASFNLQPFEPNKYSANLSPYLLPVNGLINQYKPFTPKNLVNTKFIDENGQSTNIAKPFEIDNDLSNSPDYDDTSQWNDQNNALVKSYFGKPIASSVTFNRLYNGFGPDSISVTGATDDFLFERSILTVRQAKNIIMTKIMGKDGSIKEYIGLDDFEVKIEATIFGVNGQYPFDKVDELMKYLTFKQPIYVSCDYLNQIFGVNFLVIRDYDVSMNEGISQQHIMITAMSDNFYDEDLGFSPYI